MQLGSSVRSGQTSFCCLSEPCNECSAFNSALIAPINVRFTCFACLLLIQLHSVITARALSESKSLFVRLNWTNNTVLRSTDFMRNAQSYSVEGSIIIIFESI